MTQAQIDRVRAPGRRAKAGYFGQSDQTIVTDCLIDISMDESADIHMHAEPDHKKLRSASDQIPTMDRLHAEPSSQKLARHR
jgi:hypothetical protein